MKISLKLRSRTPAQKRLTDSLKRFIVACFGRQSGKTTYGIDKMIWKPLKGRPNGIYWYILQTHSAAEIAFNRCLNELRKSPKLLGGKPNHSEKRIPLINGAQVFFKSGENYEDLRAETLDGCIIDEYRQQHKDLWPMVIRPMLSRRKGWCDFLSTPNGFDHFYDLAEYAKCNPDEWDFYHAPSSEAWWWTEEEIESAKSSMTEAEFAQEILAEFRNIHTGKVYSSEGEWNRRLTSPFCNDGGLVSKFLPVTVGLDFNVNPMAWSMGQFKGPVSYWFDEVHLTNTNTMEAATELGNKLLDLKKSGLLNASPNVRLCGDASGESRNTKATESDYTIICKELDRLKITWTNDTEKSNPPVKERVNTVNARLKSADGSVTLFYNPIKCPHLKRDFDRVSWKDGSSMLDQTTDKSLTHASDGVGYSICKYAPLELFGSVGGLTVVKR
jgi:hypothetical protein